MLLVFSVALVIALPAGAKKPPKPTPSAPVVVSLEGNLVWVHEAGDIIWYSVTVQNTTRAAVNVEVFYDDDSPSDPLVIEVEANSAHVEENLFSQTVTEDHIDDCVDDENCDLFAEVTVTYPNNGSLIAVAETSTLVDPVDECIFEDEDENPVVTKSGLCIWKPPSPGTWKVSAEPTRHGRLMMTMRDGVPGNWCTLDDYTGGIVRDRWLKSSTSIVLNVYLPGGDGAMGDGVCLLGGGGVCTEPNCYFAVGNPKSFYLYTTFDGFITLTKTGA